jgi:hypothetical protein
VSDSVPFSVPGSLEDAMPRFRDFLRAQGWPDRVQWLTAGTVLCSKKGHYWINCRKPDEGRTFAHETYQQGVRRGLGISIEALCKTDAVTFAYIFAPTDQDEAERMLISGLKLSVPLNFQRAQMVANPFRWWVLHWLHDLPIDTFPMR